MSAAQTDPAAKLSAGAMRLIGLLPVSASDLAMSDLMDFHNALVEELIDTPAETVAGIAAKLRVVQNHFDGGESDWAHALLESAIEDADRLAGGGS